MYLSKSKICINPIMVKDIGCDPQFRLFYIMTRYFRIQSGTTLCNEEENVWMQKSIK